jgi:hypothetical protein
MAVQVVVSAQGNGDTGRLETKNAQRLFNETRAVKVPVFFTMKYPRGGDAAVGDVDACKLADVDFVVYDLNGKINKRGEELIEPSVLSAFTVTAVFNNDAVGDGIGVISADELPDMFQ